MLRKPNVENRNIRNVEMKLKALALSLLVSGAIPVITQAGEYSNQKIEEESNRVNAAQQRFLEEI